MRRSNHQRVFFDLVQAGLWEKAIPQEAAVNINWQEVYRLAQEQSVVGLVLAGLERYDIKPPQALLLQWIGEVQVLEQQNKEMNTFISGLIDELRKASVYALLVKGRGIAQCYERPLWRSVGDVDLFLSDNNYRNAERILTAQSTYKEEEKEYYKHIAFVIGSWVVELHGTLRGGLWKKIDNVLDEMQEAIFSEGKARSWMNGRTQVFLPKEDEDVVYVFTHVLQHFFKEGVGLRQICDWCRLLWTYKESLDYDLLKSRISKMGLLSEWKAFGTLAVAYLGMPVEAMPFYSSNKKWKRRANRILSFIIETGNFGHNRDYSYQKKYPFLIYKLISAWKHVKDAFKYFIIFPLDTIRVTERRMRVGLRIALKGERHE